MSKKSIGMVLSELIQDSNYSIATISEKLGKTRQNVYIDLKRTSMRDDAIEKYAQALEIPKQDIYDRWNGGTTASSTPDLLSQQMERIEQFLKDQVEFQRQQIESQQRQIESQQRTIELLLGKSEGVSSGPSVSRKKLLLPGSFYDTFGHTQVTA